MSKVWIEWIDVKERLPKYNTPILVTDGTEVACCRLDCTDGDGHHFEIDESDQLEFTDVTHWAELPKPPISPVIA